MASDPPATRTRDSIVIPQTGSTDADASGLQRQCVRRLGILAAAALIVQAGSFLSVRVLDLLPAPSGGHDLAAVVAFALLSAGIIAMTRARGLRPRLVLNVGYLYQVLAALHIGMMVNRYPWPTEVWVPSWSPVAVWTLVFTVVVPARPLAAALINLASVAMDPLSLWILVEQGKPVPSLEVALVRFTPGLGAVILGLVATHLIQGLGRQVHEARQLGSYRIVDKLGSGSFGEVWLARHQVLRRPAAVKLIGPEALGARDAKAARTMVRRFEREAQATSQLRSPHTVDLYDYGLAPDGTFFYVMELLEGVDLQRLVQNFGPVAPERVVHLLAQACHSLHDAHVQGLIHRDIKPANLYACKNGFEYDFVKVLDFGLVKSSRQEDAGATRLTADGTIQGTPAYLAPETVLRDGQLDGRADLYSLACVGYWLLTGKLVFEEDVPMRMVLAHAKQPPLPPSDRVEEGIPAELERIIMQCLDKDPDRRPPTAWALRERLIEIEVRLERPWTQERARDWWKRFLPDLA